MKRSFVAALFRIILPLGLMLVGTGLVRAETKVSAYLGKSFIESSNLQIRQPGLGNNYDFKDVNWEDESFMDPFYYGLRVTHYFENTSWLGVSFDFFHFKVFADEGQFLQVVGREGGVPICRRQRLRANVQRFSISHGFNYFMFNVQARKQFRQSKGYPHGRLQPYAGVGGGFIVLHPESIVNGAIQAGWQFGGGGYQVFAGVDYGITSRFSAFLEYKHTRDTPTVNLTQGSGTADFNTHHVVFGVSYDLGD